MRLFHLILTFHLCFLICLHVEKSDGLTTAVRNQYKSLISGNGLYGPEDKIEILNVTNIKSTIYGTKNSWLVEFYNSWCGHCHKFAPTWKSLAVNLHGWKVVVRIAAIDCATDENNPVCREYDILGYPTIKFFSANSFPSNMGVEVTKRTSEVEIRKAIVGIVKREQLDGKGADWPNITPYRGIDTSNLFTESNKHSTPQFVFVIFEDTDSSLGTEVILDLGTIKGVEVRSVLSDNEVLCKLLGVSNFPSLVLVKNSYSDPIHLIPEESNRDSFRQSIKSYLEAQGFEVPNEPEKIQHIHKDEVLPDLNELMKAQQEDKSLQEIKKLGDVVFLADLENALRYTLLHEIPNKKIITGHALTALNNYLSVLAKYFPINESGIQYLQKLRDVIFESEREIRGLKFKSYVTTLSGGLESVLSTKEGWLGCKGSEPQYRGFPCSLWTLFHFMTVSAVHDADHVHFDPTEVLDSMLGYITHFFGCTECSKHFQEMANKSMRAKVTSAQSSVMWLWSAHNEVNNRLSKDTTEDSYFPKVQFPSEERCPKCRDSSGRWDEQVVYKYLTNMYHQDSLNYMGSNTRLSPPSQEKALPLDSVISSKLTNEVPVKKLIGTFNIFDISLCVVLYIVSAIICMAVCLKFVLKKRYRKKTYVHDLFGKV